MAKPALTPRERECLEWAAQGKTAWETAAILAVSEHTVNFHIKNAMRTLTAPNKAAAVRAALERGEMAGLKPRCCVDGYRPLVHCPPRESYTPWPPSVDGILWERCDCAAAAEDGSSADVEHADE